MEQLRTWIMGMVTFLLMMTLVEQMIPGEKYRKYVRLAMGLILILMISMPVMRIFGVEENVLQNFVQENLKLSSLEAAAAQPLFTEADLFTESYEQTIRREIDVYFADQSMNMAECNMDIVTDASARDYGSIRSMDIELIPLDVLSKESEGQGEMGTDTTVQPVDPVDITVGNTVEKREETVRVPKEKLEQWKKDLSLQYGVDAENITLVIR